MKFAFPAALMICAGVAWLAAQTAAATPATATVPATKAASKAESTSKVPQASAQLDSTSKVPQAVEPAVPTVVMPDKIYKVWKAAIESYDAPRYAPEYRDKNLAALEQLRGVPWPDLDKLSWVRVTTVQYPEHGGVAWCLSQTDAELVLVMPDLTARRIDRKTVAKVTPIDPAAQLDGLLAYLKNRNADNKRPWDFTFIQDFGATGLPYYGGVYLLHQAYAAAWLGREAQATTLVHEALRQQQVAFEQAINDGAWQSFNRGVEMLEAGRTRIVVLAQWERTLKTYPASRYKDQLGDLIGQLKIQLGEDAALSQAPAADPARLPRDQQIAYYIARLSDVHGEQWSQPGSCQTVGLGKGTAISDALVKIGRPALPALIEQLENRRLTRSVGFWRNFAPDRIILRYQDVAEKCIEAIVDIRFYIASSTSSYLSNEKPEVRDTVIAQIKDWYKDHGKETPLQGQLARLDTGNIYERINTLHKIEKLDAKAVDPIATLKRWAEAARKQDDSVREMVAIADELGGHGDLTLLPEIRKMSHRTENAPVEEAIWCILRWGNAEDYHDVLERSRGETHGVKLGSECVWGAALGTMDGTSNPLAVPLMVEFLGQREMTGSRYRSGFKQSMSFCAADTCIEGLIRLTGHDEGYKGDDPPEKRFAAMDRWLAWWTAGGQAAYVAKHPEVAKVLGQAAAARPGAAADAPNR